MAERSQLPSKCPYCGAPWTTFTPDQNAGCCVEDLGEMLIADERAIDEQVRGELQTPISDTVERVPTGV